MVWGHVDIALGRRVTGRDGRAVARRQILPEGFRPDQ